MPTSTSTYRSRSAAMNSLKPARCPLAPPREPINKSASPSSRLMPSTFAACRRSSGDSSPSPREFMAMNKSLASRTSASGHSQAITSRAARCNLSYARNLRNAAKTSRTDCDGMATPEAAVPPTMSAFPYGDGFAGSRNHGWASAWLALSRLLGSFSSSRWQRSTASEDTPSSSSRGRRTARGATIFACTASAVSTSGVKKGWEPVSSSHKMFPMLNMSAFWS
mmetsp:Transcript_111866/g.312747  ORF Transcript_111866/g.312747 Transcript_111866/m.312747 type:complete len:223 (+) Transcript_111866:553-1221(+)